MNSEALRTATCLAVYLSHVQCVRRCSVSNFTTYFKIKSLRFRVIYEQQSHVWTPFRRGMGPLSCPFTTIFVRSQSKQQLLLFLLSFRENPFPLTFYECPRTAAPFARFRIPCFPRHSRSPASLCGLVSMPSG